MTVYVDYRYRGHHGIARYASEVLSRLEPSYRALPVSGDPTSSVSLLDRGWRVPTRDDLIYSPGFGTGRSRARQLLTIHDLIHFEGPRRSAKAIAHRLYYEYAVKPAILRTGHVLTVSSTSARAIRSWLGDAATVHVSGNACSSAFAPSGPRHHEPTPYVVYVGNLKAHKNPEVLFRALNLLPDVALVAVTRDVERVDILARTHRVESRARVESDVTDERLAELYRGALALVIPSVIEGFGLPVVEALRCHIPVIHYVGCASISEICAGTQFAFSAPDAYEEVARAIIEVRDGAAPFEAPSRLGSYDWQHVADRVRDVIQVVATA